MMNDVHDCPRREQIAEHKAVIPSQIHVRELFSSQNIPFLSRTNPKWLGHNKSSFKFHRSGFFLCTEVTNICFGIFNFCSGINVTWKREDKSIDERGIARTASDLKQFIGNLCLWSIRRRRFLKDNSGVAAKWSRTYSHSPLARVVYPRRALILRGNVAEA